MSSAGASRPSRGASARRWRCSPWRGRCGLDDLAISAPSWRSSRIRLRSSGEIVTPPLRPRGDRAASLRFGSPAGAGATAGCRAPRDTSRPCAGRWSGPAAEHLRHLLVGERLAGLLLGQEVLDHLLHRHRRDHRPRRPRRCRCGRRTSARTAPAGSRTYLLVVTRLMVDSCMPMSSPTSRSDSGRRCGRPWSRNSRWNFTIDCVTLHSVRWRWSTLLISHTAERMLLLHVLARLVPLPDHAATVERVDAQARHAVLVQDHHVLVAHLVHEDVGDDVPGVDRREAPARLGLERHDLLDRLHDAPARASAPARCRGSGRAQLLEVLLHDLDRHRVGVARVGSRSWISRHSWM